MCLVLLIMIRMSMLGLGSILLKLARTEELENQISSKNFLIMNTENAPMMNLGLTNLLNKHSTVSIFQGFHAPRSPTQPFMEIIRNHPLGVSCFISSSALETIVPPMKKKKTFIIMPLWKSYLLTNSLTQRTIQIQSKGTLRPLTSVFLSS